jgi:glycerate 2-kinase
VTGVVRAALAAADAGGLVRTALATEDARRFLRSAAAVDVVAVGKAARPMLLAAVDAATQVPLRHVTGVSAHLPEAMPAGVRWHTAAHPVPDERSVAAARAVLDIAAGANDLDLLVLLLSGGASALMALPAEGISLEDKQRTSRRLLTEGAEIHALNAVRKHLSAIKGGQLAAAAGGSVLTLAVSDVVGDELSAIGSGPTVPDMTTFTDALAGLDRHGGRDAYPAAVVARLTAGARGAFLETPKPGDLRLSRSTARVIGGARTAIDGARAAAQSRGYVVHVIEEPVTGEARLAARGLVESAARAVKARGARLCILAAGEMTVRVAGTGKGGRNQECALAMARGLETVGAAVVAASIGTDGVDGPTDAAGGIVDTTTLARAEAADIGPPERYLEDNNAYVFLDELGDLIRTGPTNTNVGDLQVILVGQPVVGSR